MYPVTDGYKSCYVTFFIRKHVVHVVSHTLGNALKFKMFDYCEQRKSVYVKKKLIASLSLAYLTYYHSSEKRAIHILKLFYP